MATSANVKRLVLLTWALVAFFYFYLSYDYIRVSMNDKEFADYIQYVVQIGGGERRPAKEIRALILAKAEELSLDVEPERITVLGGGETLNVTLNYEVEIEVPLLRREIYTKKFEHELKFQTAR